MSVFSARPVWRRGGHPIRGPETKEIQFFMLFDLAAMPNLETWSSSNFSRNISNSELHVCFLGTPRLERRGGAPPHGLETKEIQRFLLLDLATVPNLGTWKSSTSSRNICNSDLHVCFLGTPRLERRGGPPSRGPEINEKERVK